MLLYHIFGGFCRDVCAYFAGCVRSHLAHALHCHRLWWQNSRTAHQRAWVMLRMTVDRSWYWAHFWSSWPDASMRIGSLLLSIMVPTPTREWVCAPALCQLHIFTVFVYMLIYTVAFRDM
jgi:hypothetical protein